MSTTTRTDEPAAPQSPPEAPPEPTPPRSAGAAGRRASSDVGAMRAFALAIPFYGLAMLGASLAPASTRAILLERGWPPHATMVLTCLSLSILLLKGIALRRQRRAFALDLLPDVGPRIGPEAAARLADHVASIRGLGGARSFLVERVLRVLSQYAANGDVAEASAANEADADADAASVAASFSTVKVMVWAMPILGLIGTVVGLSAAVGAFSHSMSGAEQLDTIKDSLRQVTTGLAVAFDATFVALVASILVMLPMTWLQKAEDKLVNDVDDFCATHVLTRLGGASAPAVAAVEEASPAPAAGLDAGEIRRGLLDALAQPLSEMLTANAKVMDRLSADRVAVAGAQEALVAQLSAVAAALQQAAPAMDRSAGQIERATAELGPSAERVAAELGRAAAVGPSLDRAALGLERAVTQLERATHQMETRVAPGVERAAGQIERATTELGASVERAVTQLEVTTAVADQAAAAAERAQDQLGRELGASRQLLSLLAAGLGAGEASPPRPRHANGASGANGAGAGRGD